jgi:hypothetical protein
LTFDIRGEWQKTLDSMGLNFNEYVRGQIYYPISGEYRNHPVKVYGGDVGFGVAYIGTYYDVEFDNSSKLLMGIRKHSFLTRFTDLRHLPPHKAKGKEILTNDSTFDKTYSVIGTNRDAIRSILDLPLRTKILNLGDFNIIIGFSRLTTKNQFVDNVARHIEKGVQLYQFDNPNQWLIQKVKKTIELFKTKLDITLDLVEKIEALPPTS